MSRRIASTSSGTLENLSNPNNPDTGGLPCTASGGRCTPVRPGTVAAAAVTAENSADWRAPKMKSASGTTPVSLSTVE